MSEGSMIHDIARELLSNNKMVGTFWMQPKYGSKDALQIGKLMYEEQNKWE
jgi:hypothetical protein